MSNEHTPTPWKKDGLEVWATKPTRFNLVSAGTPRICVVDNHHSESGFEQANAAHIVKCVNMHDELVGVLELARQDLADWIEVLEDDDNWLLGDTRMVINRISEVLKKAGAL